MKPGPIIFFDILPSTNGFASEKLGAGEIYQNGAVFWANHQTAGRGRFDRTWLDTPGESLTFSMLIYPDVPAEFLLSLPLAAGLGVQRALFSCGIDAKLKWPNDVLVGGKKICGLLCENVTTPAGQTAVIIGIGINVNLSAEFVASIDQPATSMLVETGRIYELKNVLDDILASLCQTITPWLDKGCDAIRDDWLAASGDINREVIVNSSGGQINGTITGLGKLGQLLIQNEQGQTIEIIEGDVKRI